MKDALIQCMQRAQDWAQASQASRQANRESEEEQGRKKRKKSVVVPCLQWVLRGVGIYWQTSADKIELYEERKRKKRKRDRRVTLAIAIVMGALYIFSISPLGAHTATTGQKNSLTAMDKARAAMETVMQPYNKAATLRSSAAEALTAYPSASGSDTLSSATIDEQTGNQSYERGMGKGGEALPGDSAGVSSNSNVAAGSNNNGDNAGSDGCNGYSKSASGGGNKQDISIPACPTYKADPADFMTGTQCQSDQTCGLILRFPVPLTTGNKFVQSALGAMQILAFACITPLLALIGMNVMSGAITSRYADGVEALSRLIPAAAGIAFSLELVNFVVQLEGDLVQGMFNVFGSPDMSKFIPPANSWLETLVWVLAAGIGLVAAKSVAPLLVEVLGTGVTIGPFIAVAVEIALKVALLVMIPHLILVIFAMALCTQYLIRVLLVNLYIILSPLAIAAAVMPGQNGVGFTRDWILGLLSLLASQVAQSIILLLGVQMVSGLQVNSLVTELIKYGTITMMMRAPSLFQSNATGMVSQVGSSAVGVATGPYLAFM